MKGETQDSLRKKLSNYPKQNVVAPCVRYDMKDTGDFKMELGFKNKEDLSELQIEVQQTWEQRKGTGTVIADKAVVEFREVKTGTDPDFPLPVFSPYADNVLESRPYFTVPLKDAGLKNQASSVSGQIAKRVEDLKKASRPVTDIFVVSHGWHRNLFTGVAAYDRLLARFAVLRNRKVIETDPNFSPLFIALQWISDPGIAGFVDPQGRRNKQSFIDLASKRFHTKDDVGQFLNDFEVLFERLSRSCAPETKKIGREDRELAQEAAKLLDTYMLKEAPKATIDEKVVVLWTCYHEALPKAVLCDQDETPRPTSTIPGAILTTAKFIFGIIGFGFILSALQGLIPKAPKLPTLDAVSASANEFWIALQAPMQFNESWAIWKWPVWQSPAVPQVAGVFLGALLILACHAAYYHTKKQDPKRGRVPIVLTLAWLLVQIPLTLPVLAYLLVTYLLRTPWVFIGAAIALSGYPIIGLAFAAITIAWAAVKISMRLPAKGVFAERSNTKRVTYWRERLAAIARFPINLIKAAAPADSLAIKMALGMDNQFAFFEMQRKGVEAGEEAGAFLYDVVKDIPDAKLHFIGHSFGGLVVLNTVRGLMQKANPENRGQKAAPISATQAKLPIEIRSLCLVQSATASDWFREEPNIVKCVTGSISCIHSRYDTANGFYYPFANNGRMAAGFVGLCDVGAKGKMAIEEGNEKFIILSKPPVLDFKGPVAVNLDASRLVYEGSVAVGGGHDDVFKDDVVNLIWSAVSIKP